MVLSSTLQSTFYTNWFMGLYVMIGHPDIKTDYVPNYVLLKFWVYWLVLFIKYNKIVNIQTYLYINLACLFVCLYPINGWTDRAQIFCGTSRDSREGLSIIKISNICLHQNSIVIKFLKILKIREIFCENPRLFYDVHKENMFTINLEDGREAPSKASNKYYS